MRQLAGNNDTTFLGKVRSKTASAKEKLLRYFCILIKLNSTRSCLIKLSQPESVTAERSGRKLLAGLKEFNVLASKGVGLNTSTYPVAAN